MADNKEQETNADRNKDTTKVDPKDIASKVSEKVTQLAGVDKLEGFRLKDFFAEVFKKHTTAEVEDYFTVGTSTTTPNIEDVNTSWPRPWFFSKRLLVLSSFISYLFRHGVNFKTLIL